MRWPFHLSRFAVFVLLLSGDSAFAQLPAFPRPEASDRVLPINLATALQLAHARPLDVQIAARQVTIAARQLDRAKLLWVPNIVTGVDYFRHEGGQQNFAGDIVRSSRGSFGVGVGPNVVFNLSDAIHAPLVAKQDLRVRQAQQQATANDLTLAVAEAYFSVQQARGELAGSTDALEKAEEASRKAGKLADNLAPPLEADRARVELARRRQVVATARERWRLASAELVRLLRLEPGTLVEPLEPPQLTVPIIDPAATVDALIPIGLTNRPELAAHQAVVQAAIGRLKQEKLRPLVPSLALRSTATNPSGSLAWAGFGGGPNDKLNNFGGRFDIDLQILWEFQSLGFGNKARVGERRAEQEAATLELFRAQDRVAAEVSTAFAQVQAATDRLAQSTPALKDAKELVDKSLTGMTQTRRIGTTVTLVVRPQEVVAAVQSFGQANADYYAAVGDYNRAQFRLYRALGHPGHSLASAVPQFEVSSDSATPPAVAPKTKPERPASEPTTSAVHPPLVPLVITPKVYQTARTNTPPRDALGVLPATAVPPMREPTAIAKQPIPLPAPKPLSEDIVQVSASARQPLMPATLPPLPATTPRISPWDLPLTRHMLIAGQRKPSFQPVAHQEPATPPGEQGWQPILPDTGTAPATLPKLVTAPALAKPTPPPVSSLPSKSETPDDLKWEPIQQAEPAKKKYDSFFR